MLRNASCILLVALYFGAGAQNLVVNPSFEGFSLCPNDLDQMDRVTSWTGIWGSADYFNGCADDTMSVPFNAIGYQWPSEGAAYVGMLTFPMLAKEYIQGELSEPLEPGMLSYVSMRVSPGGFGYPSWTSPKLAASHIGMRFSTQPIGSINDYGELEFNTSVLYMQGILSDTSSWTVLSTSFMPDSAYRYVQVGCFFTDEQVDTLVLDPLGDTESAYAFVDVVCVAQQPGVCDPIAGTPSWSELYVSQAVIFDAALVLSLDAWRLAGKAERAMLFDHGGRLVAEKILTGARGSVEWPLGRLASGLYCLKLILTDRSSFSVRSWKL